MGNIQGVSGLGYLGFRVFRVYVGFRVICPSKRKVDLELENALRVY